MDDRVEAALHSSNARHRAIIGLIALAGLTTHQVASIRRRDVLPEPPLRLKLHKGSRGDVDSLIGVDPKLAEDLRAYLLEAGPDLPPDAPLFFSRKYNPKAGRGLRREGIHFVVKKRTGLTPAKIRQQCIERWLSEGMPILEIKERLGAPGLGFLEATLGLAKPKPRDKREKKPARGRQPKTDRDEILARMVDVEGLSYGKAAIQYNYSYEPEKRLSRSAVLSAVQRLRKRKAASLGA